MKAKACSVISLKMKMPRSWQKVNSLFSKLATLYNKLQHSRRNIEKIKEVLITNSKHWLLLHLEGLFSEKQPLPVGKLYSSGRHPFGPTPGGSKCLLRFYRRRLRHLNFIVNFPRFVETSGLRKVDLNFSLESMRKTSEFF